MDESDDKPFQFSLSQLLCGTVLIGFWLACVHHSLTVDIRQPPEPEWAITAAATPPVACGLIGLLRNKIKGMLIGLAIGFATVLLLVGIMPPSM